MAWMALVVTLPPAFGFDATFEVCAPLKAKKRKKKVPANSPMKATTCPRVVGGRRSKRRLTSLFSAEVGVSTFIVDEWVKLAMSNERCLPKVTGEEEEGWQGSRGERKCFFLDTNNGGRVANKRRRRRNAVIILHAACARLQPDWLAMHARQECK